MTSPRPRDSRPKLSNYARRADFDCVDVDRIVDDWYDRAPVFPGDAYDEFTFPMPSPYEKKGEAS